jgi:hypothetical protein
MRSPSAAYSHFSIGYATSSSALAHMCLAGHERPLWERIGEESLPLRGEDPTRPRRWQTAPLEVFQESLGGGRLDVHFAIAPDTHVPHIYEKWCLYGQTMAGAGVTEEAIRVMLKSFKGQARTLRVLLEGRVQRVRCLPLTVALAILPAFSSKTLERHPAWVLPERRESLGELVAGIGGALAAHFFGELQMVAKHENNAALPGSTT